MGGRGLCRTGAIEEGGNGGLRMVIGVEDVPLRRDLKSQSASLFLNIIAKTTIMIRAIRTTIHQLLELEDVLSSQQISLDDEHVRLLVCSPLSQAVLHVPPLCSHSLI